MGTGSNVLVAGIYVQQSGTNPLPANVLFGGMGPYLGYFGISGFLPDPQITLFDVSGKPIATEQAWGQVPVPATGSSASPDLGNGTVTVGQASDSILRYFGTDLPANSTDSALLTVLGAGRYPTGYTAQVSGISGDTGVALIEAFDADSAVGVTGSTTRLINLSARAYVGTGANELIAGLFIQAGQSGAPQTVLIRARGPGLSQYGVIGVLAQPTITLYDLSSKPIATNIGWQNPSVYASGTGASPLVAAGTARVFAANPAVQQALAYNVLETGSNDCAMLVTLPAGGYTAIVSGVGSTTGVALVEVFDANAAVAEYAASLIPAPPPNGGVGASAAVTTYRAADMVVSGGTVIGPPAQLGGLADPFTYAIQDEATGGKAVQLNGPGQYVEFTAQGYANSLVMRYCIPDTPDGSGQNATLSLFQNGAFVREIPVTSKYSWRYGAYPFSNLPSDGIPRNFFDEVRLTGLTINPGDTVRIEQGSSDTAAYYVVDLVDLENVDAALGPPGNSLSVLDYGAVGDGSTDSTAAIQNCINAAATQGKAVWIPPGNFVVTGALTLPTATTLQGAGMWYTTLVGNPALYNASSSRRISLTGAGNNIRLSDFAVTGCLNYRNDNEPNDGLVGSYGTGSSISRVWVEHTKTGAWIVNSQGLVINGCRFRNTIADGCNLVVGMQNCVVENCTARGTGDDCFAIWPATYLTQDFTPGGNQIVNCTGQLPNLANGAGIYGGASNSVENCVFTDIPYGCGILLSGTFPVGANGFSGTTVVTNCSLTRCGGYDPGWQWRGALTLFPQTVDISGVNISQISIADSLSYGVQVAAPGSSAGNGALSNASLDQITLTNYGLAVAPNNGGNEGVYGVWAGNGAFGSLSIAGLTVDGTAINSLPTSGSAMTDVSGNFSFIF